MKLTRFASNAARLAALTCVIGAMVGIQKGHAAVVDTYFPMTLTTTTDGVDSFTAYTMGRLNDGYYGGTEEYGAQVTIGSGVPTVLRGISFYYFSDFSSVGALTYRIYANDGPVINGLASPNSFLFEGTADVVGDPAGAISALSVSVPFDPVNNVIPTTLTLTLEFTGLDATHHAGWLTSEKVPTVGTHAPVQFWHTYDQATTWYTAAIIPVPEVNSAAVVGLALVGLGVARFIRRSKA